MVKEAGAWEIVVDRSPDPLTGKRRRVTRLVRALNDREGEKAAKRAEAELILTAGDDTISDSSGLFSAAAKAWYERGLIGGWSQRTAEEYERLLEARALRVGERCLSGRSLGGCADLVRRPVG